MSAPQGGIQVSSQSSGSHGQAGADPKKGKRRPTNNNAQQSANPRRTGKPATNPNVYTRPRKGDNSRTTYRKPKEENADSGDQLHSQSQNTGAGSSSNQNNQRQVSSQRQQQRRQRQNGPKREPYVYANGTTQGNMPQNSESLGGLFDDPASFGFSAQPSSRPPRPIPRYMLSQPRMIETPEFKQDEWDRQNQEKMLQMERENDGRDYQGIYEAFQKMRDEERKKMEELGLVDAENTRKDLNEAIVFQGTCLDMCPVFERVRRALENNVKSFEKDPATNKISRERAVKAFSRPAAGQPPSMPSDVRPPHVLQKTLDYIIDNALEKLPDSHSFIWDRTRSIRQDFIYQNCYGPEAIDCNERIVRIHLLSLHIMAGSDVEYSQQQELEQLNKALQTLTEIYQDVRNHGGVCPNEAEFRAYHLISHFRDPELEREIQTLPDEILKGKQVQLALRFRMLMSQNNVIERGYTNSVGALNLFVEFFRLVYSPETPFLLACLLETHFNEYRFYALKSMTRAYHTKGRAFLATSLQQMLGFDTLEQVVAFVQYYEVDTIEEDGVLRIDLFNKEKLETKYKLNSYNDKPKLAQAYSEQLNRKSKGLRLRDYVNSGLSNANLNLKRTSQPIISLVPKKPIRASQASQRADNMTPMFNKFGSNSSTTQAPAPSVFGQSSQNNAPSTGFTGFGSSSLGGVATSSFGQPTSQSANSGFGSTFTTTKPVGSLNLEDFLKAQNGSSKEPAEVKPEVNLGNNTPSFNFSTPQPPSFGQSSQSAFATEENKAASQGPLEPPEKLPHKVTFGSAVKIPFDSKAQPNQDSGFQPQIVELKDEKTPLTRKEPSFSLSAPSSAEPKPSTNKFEPPKIAELPKIQTPVKLKELGRFPAALEATFDAILSDVIDEELQRMLPRIIKYENRATERQKLINGLALELYRAFVDEVVYESSLRALADRFEKRSLVRSTLHLLRNSCARRKSLNDQRKQRTLELHSTSFKKPTLKRVASTTSSRNSSLRKRANHSPHNESFSQMNEKQMAIRDLWQPLNLDQFISTCSTRIKRPSEAIRIKCLLVVEDWALAHSKWLNTKFSLQVSQDRQYYRSEAKNDTLDMSFESLPSGNSLKDDAFDHTAFMVFECGLVDKSQTEIYGSLSAKLKRDGDILQKLFQICARYCSYKVQVLLVLWDVEEEGIIPAQVKQLMRLEDAPHDIIQDVILCDMSSRDESVAETLRKGMQRVSERFRGKLTPRGVKQKVKLEQELVRRKREEEEKKRKARTTEEAEQTLRTKEAEALKAAEQSRRLGYLNRHLDNSRDLSNASFRTAANTTRGLNTTFGLGNHTMLNLNDSFLNSTTVLPPKDISVLGAFGNNVSVLEESTPFGSPRPSVSRGSLSKKVNDLRDLTASIRAKYKKQS